MSNTNEEIAHFRVTYREGNIDKLSQRFVKPFTDFSFEQVFIQFKNMTNDKYEIQRVSATSINNGRYEYREVLNGELAENGVRG